MDDGHYVVEVIADSSGKWYGNQLKFATVAEAEGYALDLYLRWTLVRDWRIVKVSGEVRQIRVGAGVYT